MTREQLRQYRDLSKERNQLEKQLNGISVTLAALSPYVPRQRLNFIGQRVSTTILPKLDRLTEELAEIENALETLEVRERLLLRSYYIEGRKWDDVCQAVGYERSQAYKIHAAALEKLEQNHLLTGEKQD